MFRRTSERLYWWPIKVTVPCPEPEKAGEVMEMPCRLLFHAIPLEEARKLAEEELLLPAGERPAFEVALLKRVVRDWADVVEDDGRTPTPFGEFEATLGDVFFRAAVYRHYLESLSGEKAREGN